MSFRFAAACAAAVLLAFGAQPAGAHEGHDHAEQPVAVSGPLASRAEASSEAFELVAIAKDNELLIYLDDFATNIPVQGAGIDVETPDGPKAAVAGEGQPYRLKAPFLAKPGRYDLIFTVTAGSAVDILPLTIDIADARARTGASASHGLRAYLASVTQPATLGALALGVVLGAAFVALTRKRRAAALALLFLLALFPGPGTAHEGHYHADQKTSSLSADGELAQRLSDGTIFVPKPVQRIFSIGTALTESGSFNRSIELPGRVIPDPNASGFVQASVGGRLSAPPGGFPRLGTQVKEGDVLAYVTPPLQAIDVSDMRQRQGELEQQISIVARRLARYEQLAPSGAVARSQLEDTRLELEGLKERRASLDKVRREAESLVAPVAGVIADGTPVAGQITQPNAVVFHIVDPGKLWVEALSFAAITTSSASAATASGKNLKLAFRGSGFADRNQTIPVHFAVEGEAGGLRAGQFVTVLVTTDEKKQGIAVPRTALVRNANGQDFVFEHVAAERFAARAVRTEPLDGERILILAGVERGKRIVVQGAELLDHVR
jgi:cobalt-zinc-cadmium efflux system membrane fusion protein